MKSMSGLRSGLGQRKKLLRVPPKTSAVTLFLLGAELPLI